MEQLEAMGRAAKEAAAALARISAAQKSRLLEAVADELLAMQEAIVAANTNDMEKARQQGLPAAMLDRLLLSPERLSGVVADVRKVAGLPDPVGQVLDGRLLPNGIRIERRRVPLGVIGVIYEARPNVTVDVASLCLKTGNAAILRGGKETLLTNLVLASAIRTALARCGLPEDCVQLVESTDRALVSGLLRLSRYVDMIIPRGGSGLQKHCMEEATIPVIVGGIGVCHIYLDESADEDKALPIIENAKVQRPTVCNSVETLLVHENRARAFLPKLSSFLARHGVVLHGCPKVMEILQPLGNASYCPVVPWRDEELSREWLTVDLNVGVVPGIDAAIGHIHRYGSGHTEAILTENMQQAEYFVQEVDSSALFVNTSTRFTDGGEFGLGAEVAISTQKLHARGPMGLEALTTYKWIGRGDHLIR